MSAFQAATRARLSSVSLTMNKYTVLVALTRKDGVSQVEISRQVGISSPALVHNLADLEREGLVRRERKESDKRIVCVFLTQKGKKAVQEGMKAGENANVVGLGGFSEKEKKALFKFLDRIRENLSGVAV